MRNGHSAYKNALECDGYLDKVNVLFRYQKEFRNIRMKAELPLVRQFFFPEMHTVSLS